MGTIEKHSSSNVRHGIVGAAKPESNNSHQEVLDDLHWINTLVPASLLDVGCGGGHFLLEAATRGLDVYGIDADFRMVLETRRKLASVKDVHSWIIRLLIGQTIPSTWPRFSYVTCFEVLEHTENPVVALQWIRNALAPSGYLVGSVPESPKGKLSRQQLLDTLPETDDALREVNRHKNLFDEDTLLDAVISSGFSACVIKHVVKGSGPHAKKRLLFKARNERI